MADELDTLIKAVAAAMGTILDEGVPLIHVIHEELPPLLTDPPEMWVKIGSGISSPVTFGLQGEVHAIELWLWLSPTDASYNEARLRKLWHAVLRKIVEDDSFGGACEGVHDTISYTTSWQTVGRIEYRKMEIIVPCAMNVVVL